MLNIEEKIKKDIKTLTDFKFNITYSKKSRILMIEKGSLMIHGIKDILMVVKEEDSEIFNIFNESFKSRFSFYISENYCFGIKVGTNYIFFDLREYLGLLRDQKDFDSIRTTIGSLISMHINNNFEYLEGKDRVKNLILAL